MTATAPSQERRFGRFTLREELGSGAMGTVHRAFDPESGAECALKVLALPLAAFPEVERRELLKRFEREARLASSVDHAGIARVHGAGEADGVPWIAMDLVQGETLGELVKRRRREPEFRREVVAIVAEAADALQAAHEKGVVHRDVKPANVLVERDGGRARVTDFGLAREVAPGSRLTQDGQVIGTPQYMAPEQARGDLDAIDAQTDVYGLGATLYEGLTGRPPFQGDVAWKVALEVIRGSPEAPRAVDPSIPEPLDAICRCAMAHRKEARYASAKELAQELRAWLTQDGSVRGRPRAPRGPTLGYIVRLVLKQHRITACVTAVALLVIVSGAAFFLWRLRVLRERAEQRAEVARATLDVMIYEVRDQLADLPGDRVRSVRRRLLESAIAGIEDLRDAVAKDAPTSLAAAEAQRQIGDLALAAGLGPRADEAFQRALEISRRAAFEDPSAVEPRLDVVESLVRIGRARRARGEPAEALASLGEADGALRSLRKDVGEGKARAGSSGLYAYWSYFVSDEDDAGATAELAILGALVETVGETADTRLEISDPGALASCREAVVLARESVAKRPQSASARRKLALALERLAGALSRAEAYSGGLAGGRDEAEEAVKLARESIAGAGSSMGPERPEAAADAARERERDLVQALLTLAAAARTAGDVRAALDATAEAQSDARDLFGLDATSVRARLDLAAALVERALSLRAAGRPEALETALEATRTLAGLVEQDPGDAPSRRALVDALLLEAELHLERGEVKATRESLERAVLHTDAAVGSDPASPEARRERARALSAYAAALDVEGDPAQAEKRRRQAIDVLRPAVARAPWLAPDLARLEADLGAAERTERLLSGEAAPEGAKDLLLLGERFARRREWARAAERFQAALADEGARADLAGESLFRGARAAARAAEVTAGKEAQVWRERALRWLADDVQRRAAQAGGRRARAVLAHLARIDAEPAFSALRGTSEFQAATRASE